MHANVAYCSLTHFSATVSGNTCSADIDGTAAGADDGTAHFAYYNASGELAALKGSTILHAYDVTGCTGVFSDGDALWWHVWFWIVSTHSAINTITSA